MKKIKLICIILSIILLLIFKSGWSQTFYMQAMQQELTRSMDSLKLEKMLSPLFISYSIVDAKAIQVSANLGGIIKSEETPFRKFENRLLVGANGKTNENYLNENNIWAWSRFDNDIPLSENKNDIRRALWLITDDNYKNAIINFEAKVSALNQQNFTEDEKLLPDFYQLPGSEITVPYKSFYVDKSQLEILSRNLSSTFIKYPVIQTSNVNVFSYDGQVLFANSEGSKSQYPFQIASVKVTATTQAPGGEVLQDHVVWFATIPTQLPDEKNITMEVAQMAKNLTLRTTAPAISEPYCGPVLFEGQAAAEVFVQLFFIDVNGLVAVRKPLIGNQMIVSMYPDKVKENKLEAMMNKKIVSRDITIESLPTLTTYQNIPLIGTYTVDAEGVKSPEKLVLVDNGVLVNLLCDRTPTLKIKQSNGHSRPVLSNGSIKSATGPGVIKMTNNNPATVLDFQRMKEKLLSTAKEEDLEYAYIVRKVVSGAANFTDENEITFYGNSKNKKDLSKTIQVFRVKVSDGSEELVSFAEIQGLNIKSFKRLLATSSQMQVYNTMVKPISTTVYNYQFGLSGIPASFILPQALLFQELDVVKEKQDVIKKLPVVKNPLNSVK